MLLKGAKQFCTAIPLARENLTVSPFPAMENQSRKFAVEIIRNTKSTESGWDIVNSLVALCTVVCSRFVANTILIAQLSCLSC